MLNMYIATDRLVIVGVVLRSIASSGSAAEISSALYSISNFE